jgi:hypothetical protein
MIAQAIEMEQNNWMSYDFHFCRLKYGELTIHIITDLQERIVILRMELIKMMLIFSYRYHQKL